MGIKHPPGLFMGVNGRLGVLGQNSVLTLILIKYLSNSSAEYSLLVKEHWELWKFQIECFESYQDERSQTHTAMKIRGAAPKVPLRTPFCHLPNHHQYLPMALCFSQDSLGMVRMTGWCCAPIPAWRSLMGTTMNCTVLGYLQQLWAVLSHYPCRLCTCHCIKMSWQGKIHPGVRNNTDLFVLTQPEGRDGAAKRKQTPATLQGTATSNHNISGSPGILHCQETLIFPKNQSDLGKPENSVQKMHSLKSGWITPRLLQPHKWKWGMKRGRRQCLVKACHFPRESRSIGILIDFQNEFPARFPQWPGHREH